MGQIRSYAAPVLQVMEAELKGTSPEMASVFLAAAASGSLNEPNISLASLGRTFGPLQHQVRRPDEAPCGWEG